MTAPKPLAERMAEMLSDLEHAAHIDGRLRCPWCLYDAPDHIAMPEGKGGACRLGAICKEIRETIIR